MDQRVKVRIGNRKVMDTKQGSLEMKMGQGSEFRYGVTQSVTLTSNSITLLILFSTDSILEFHLWYIIPLTKSLSLFSHI